MNGVRYLGVFVLLLGTVAHAADRPPENKLPARVVAALEKADEVELYSLGGDTDNPDGWHGAKVLGKTTATAAADRKALAAALKKGVDEGKDGARCFVPRHGLHVTHAGKSYDVLICFECHWLYVYTEGSDKPLVLITSDTPQKVLNKLLSDAKVPLAKPEKREK
jgi:hypothetical protein